MKIALSRSFSAPHRTEGAEGYEGRPHHHLYRIEVALPGEPDDEQVADIAALLDLAVAATNTSEWAEWFTPTQAAWWFREHLLFRYRDVTIRLTRETEMGATVVEVP